MAGPSHVKLIHKSVLNYLGDKLNAFDFISDLICQRIVRHALNVNLAPREIICLNISSAAKKRLSTIFPHATFKDISFSDLNKPSIENESIELLLANLAFNSNIDEAFLSRVKNILAKNGIFIFGLINSNSVNLLKMNFKSLPTQEIGDSKEVMLSLNKIHFIRFYRFLEHVFPIKWQHQFVDIDIFIFFDEKMLTPLVGVLPIKQKEVDLSNQHQEEMMEEIKESDHKEIDTEYDEAELNEEEILKEGQEILELLDHNENLEANEETNEHGETESKEEEMIELGENESKEEETAERGETESQEKEASERSEAESKEEKTTERSEAESKEVETTESSETEFKEKEETERGEVESQEKEASEQSEAESKEDETNEQSEDESEEVEESKEEQEDLNRKEESIHEDDLSEKKQEQRELEKDSISQNKVLYQNFEQLNKYKAMLVNHHQQLSQSLDENEKIFKTLAKSSLTEEERHNKKQQLKENFQEQKKLLNHYKSIFAEHTNLVNDLIKDQEKTLLNNPEFVDNYHKILEHHLAVMNEHQDKITEHEKMIQSRLDETE